MTNADFTKRDLEDLLLVVLAQAGDRNTRAILLQNFIQQFGPLSEAAGARVRKILEES